MGGQETLSATVIIDASADDVFAVLADPASHAAIDGTGWVQGVVDRAPLTEAGQVFRMAMFHARHPDRNYRTANKVHVLDRPRAIGWFTGTEDADGRLEFGGWLWRYDLEPLGPSRTEVTLTYDWSAVPPRIRQYLRFPPFAREHLTNSLDHLAELTRSRRDVGGHEA
jgi:hypothetical protein